MASHLSMTKLWLLCALRARKTHANSPTLDDGELAFIRRSRTTDVPLEELKAFVAHLARKIPGLPPVACAYSGTAHMLDAELDELIAHEQNRRNLPPAPAPPAAAAAAAAADPICQGYVQLRHVLWKRRTTGAPPLNREQLDRLARALENGASTAERIHAADTLWQETMPGRPLEPTPPCRVSAAELSRDLTALYREEQAKQVVAASVAAATPQVIVTDPICSGYRDLLVLLVGRRHAGAPPLSGAQFSRLRRALKPGVSADKRTRVAKQLWDHAFGIPWPPADLMPPHDVTAAQISQELTQLIQWEKRRRHVYSVRRNQAFFQNARPEAPPNPSVVSGPPAPPEDANMIDPDMPDLEPISLQVAVEDAICPGFVAIRHLLLKRFNNPSSPLSTVQLGRLFHVLQPGVSSEERRQEAERIWQELWPGTPMTPPDRYPFSAAMLSHELTAVYRWEAQRETQALLERRRREQDIAPFGAADVEQMALRSDRRAREDAVQRGEDAIARAHLGVLRALSSSNMNVHRIVRGEPGQAARHPGVPQWRPAENADRVDAIMAQAGGAQPAPNPSVHMIVLEDVPPDMFGMQDRSMEDGAMEVAPANPSAPRDAAKDTEFEARMVLRKRDLDTQIAILNKEESGPAEEDRRAFRVWIEVFMTRACKDDQERHTCWDYLYAHSWRMLFDSDLYFHSIVWMTTGKGIHGITRLWKDRKVDGFLPLDKVNRLVTHAEGVLPSAVHWLWFGTLLFQQNPFQQWPSPEATDVLCRVILKCPATNQRADLIRGVCSLCTAPVHPTHPEQTVKEVDRCLVPLLKCDSTVSNVLPVVLRNWPSLDLGDHQQGVHRMGLFLSPGLAELSGVDVEMLYVHNASKEHERERWRITQAPLLRAHQQGKKIPEGQDEDACVSCMVCMPTVRSHPCQHARVCGACALGTLSRCALCRSHIESWTPIEPK